MSAQPAELLPAVPALRLVPAPVSAPPYDDEPGSPVLRLVPSGPPAPAPVFDEETWNDEERTPTAALPASHVFTRRLLQAVVEVLAGVRSVKQLQRDTTPELYLELAEALSHRPRAHGLRPDQRTIRSLHLQERPEGVVEACATVRRDDRYVALALRLEGFDGRWRCTELVGV
jgi:hypothetical protein